MKISIWLLNTFSCLIALKLLSFIRDTVTFTVHPLIDVIFSLVIIGLSVKFIPIFILFCFSMLKAMREKR
ncbi:hypothetical protein [Rodentibacter haemolyticus]|uniref:Uncharacterized protein n=1 Tax=Rodentibacter haemolyticus TaxID=2778911 RepID=A0ABX6UUW5_9PAST|nr:hypothetical protein [Rodentibacter haemolyticus]QPB41623.1 hypothetical protein IHV77_06645 [Rodentibacter haemolyticus]